MASLPSVDRVSSCCNIVLVHGVRGHSQSQPGTGGWWGGGGVDGEGGMDGEGGGGDSTVLCISNHEKR